jgi:hypothetical protein
LMTSNDHPEEIIRIIIEVLQTSGFQFSDDSLQ